MLLSLEKNKQDRISLILLAGWALFLLISIFLTPLSILARGGVLISLLARLVIIFSLWILFQRIFGSKELTKESYEKILLYIGYAIVFTYVFSMLPQVVSDFNKLTLWNNSAFYIIWVVLTTAWPAALWCWLNMDKNRTALGAYTPKQIKKRQEIRKDKKKKKALQKKNHDERSFWENVWVEWVEPLFGAVLWVLIINHFVLQLYQIPSESMVPTFLIKDRVLVGKSFYAPNIPLTQFKLPRLVKPKEGEVIIFTNPKVEDPQSDLYYNSVFTRVFHTFVYMISFTTIDIDARPDGSPKARMLVKRNIAGPGEQLCMVNDQVYKRTAGGDWTAMADIPGQQEYGQADLYSSLNPLQQRQYVTLETRQLIDEAISLVETVDEFQLERELRSEKRVFLELAETISREELESWDRIINEKILTMEGEGGEINRLYNTLKPVVELNRLSLDRQSYYTQVFQDSFTYYEEYLLLQELRSLLVFLANGENQSSYLQNLINTEIDMLRDESPYGQFMVPLNALYKLNRLRFYNEIMAKGIALLPQILNEQNSEDLYHLLFFARGLGPMQPFGAANLPVYPAGEEEFIPEDEYFLMGDNRYNSLDTRMGDSYRIVYIDEADQSDFALQAYVGWDPHTVPLRLIHGKVRFIFFPLDRARFFR